jgi:hypothetical protein
VFFMLRCFCYTESDAFIKLSFTENHPCPSPKGRDDFQRLPPYREGQEVDENREIDSIDTAPELCVIIHGKVILIL